MPLLPGKQNIGSNISELESTGKYPHKQAIAIALDEARRTGAKIPFHKRGVKKQMPPPRLMQ